MISLGRGAWAFVLLAVMGLNGCCDENCTRCADGHDTGPGSDAAAADGGTPDAGDQDAGPDALADMGPDARIPGLTAAQLCTPINASQQVQAVSGDGKQVAYVTCVAGGGQVEVRELGDDGEPIVIAPAEPNYSVRFLFDDGYLLYGAEGEWFIRVTDAAAPAVRVAAGTVEHTRPFLERVSSTRFDPRLLVLERQGSLRRVSVRGVDDGYQAAETLLESKDLQGGLDDLAASGRTLVLVLDAESGARYVKLRTNNAKAPAQLSFGPDELAMAPVGLGDTHNFAFAGERLVRVELDTGDTVELVASGLLEGAEHLIDREDSPGVKYAHFIVDGNPSRRIRDATAPLETLAEANATAQVLSPDGKTIIYASDAALWAVSAIGASGPIELIADTGTLADFVVAFAPDSSEVALRVASGGLRRAPLDGQQPSAQVEAAQVIPDSLAYNGDGSQLLWITGTSGSPGTLRTASRGTGGASTVAANVVSWMPIPASSDVFYVAEGRLIRRAF